MKVLVSSVACFSGGGSEGIYGWRACLALAMGGQTALGCKAKFVNASGHQTLVLMPKGLIGPTCMFVYGNKRVP